MRFSGDLELSGHMKLSETARIEGNIQGAGTLEVDGALSIEGNVSTDPKCIYVDATPVLIAQRVHINGNLEGKVKIIANDVHITGNRGRDTVIESENITVEGLDYYAIKKKQEDREAARADMVGRGWLSRLFKSRHAKPYVRLSAEVNIPRINVPMRYKAKSDGFMEIVGTRLVTRGASHTIVKITIAGRTETVRVIGGDIDENGHVTAEHAQVFFDGLEVGRDGRSYFDLGRSIGINSSHAFRKDEAPKMPEPKP